MAHAQKPDFVFRRNGRVHLNRRGRFFSRLLAAESFASALVMLDTPSPRYCESTGYPLHSPVSPSLPLLCVTVCHHISNALYLDVYCVGDYFASRFGLPGRKEVKMPASDRYPVPIPRSCPVANNPAAISRVVLSAYL